MTMLHLRLRIRPALFNSHYLITLTFVKFYFGLQGKMRGNFACWGRFGAFSGNLGGVLGRLGCVLGASWGALGCLGCVLGRLGSVLGASWGRLGASWGRLGASWGILGASCGRLEAVLVTSWGGLGRVRCVLWPCWRTAKSNEKPLVLQRLRAP